MDMFLVYFLLLASDATTQVPVVSASDLERFPIHAVVYDETVLYTGETYCVERKAIDYWMCESKEHWEYCRERRELRDSPWIDWLVLEQEAFRVFMAWNWLCEADMDKYGPFVVTDLNELRLLIGYNAYWAGVMPIPQTWHRGFIP